MARLRHLRAGHAAVAIGSVSAVVLAGIMSTPAVAADHGKGTPAKHSAPGKPGVKAFDFEKDAAYVLDMRNAGIEENTQIPASIYEDIGYSAIQLTHDLGQPQGKCDARTGGYWFGQYVEEAVLSKGAAPPDAGDVSGGYSNPVLARSDKPDLSATKGDNLTDRHPFIQNPFPPGKEVTALPADGTPIYVNTNCVDDLQGTGTGNVFDVAKVADVVGSTVEAAFDKSSGVYKSTSRAYIAGIKGAGVLSALSSFMTVTQKAGEDPVVTYRMSLIDNDSSGTVTGLNQNGLSVSGSNVPANQLTDQFNSQMGTLAGAMSSAGPFYVRVLAPETGNAGPSETGTSGKFVTAPSIQLDYGTHVRDGGIGQHQITRLGVITFTGVYGDH